VSPSAGDSIPGAAGAPPTPSAWPNGAAPWVGAAVTAGVVALLTLLDRWLTPTGGAVVPWLAAGAGLAATVRRGGADGLGMAAGIALASLALGDAPSLAFGQASAAALAVGLAGWTLHRSGSAGDFERARDIGLLMVATAGIAAPVLALGHGALSFASGRTVGAALGGAVGAWPWVASGLLLTSVPLLAWSRPARKSLHLHRDRWLAILIGGLAGASAVVWLVPAPEGIAASASMAWWPHVLLLALLAMGSLTVPATVTLLITVLASAAVRLGLGPFGGLVGTEAQQAIAGYAGSLLAVMLLVRAAGQEIRLRERRAAQALRAARVAVAEWHLQRPGEVHLSGDWLALTRRQDRRGWNVARWLEDVHPDDRRRLAEALEDVAQGRAPVLQQELRVQSREGWHWADVNVLPSEHDQAGRPLRLLATMSEVSERHEAQERQRLSVSLFEHLHEGLLIADAELKVLDANAAYCQILGVPLAELLGAVPSLLRPSGDPLARQQRAAMWAGLQTLGRWRGELIERRRNGEVCTLQATISQVRGPEGDLRYHVLAISDVTEQRMQRERLERQAHFDELTRLPNRARLTQLLAEAMRAAERDGYLLAVCYLDLDRFKPVNDRYGHSGGDRLLVELAGRLRGALRSRDMWADAAARLGGDEFVLLLRAGTLEEARLAVERVLRVVQQPYMIDPDQEPVQVTASVGATVYPIDRSDADTLLRHADHAMYGAKQSGRNGYLFFDPELRRRTEERVMAIGRVQEALDRAEFVLHYQPIVDMRSGRVIGLEALLRWEHPEKGLIAPLQFLPLIDNTGLSARIGDWVLGQALDHLAQWRRGGLDITVNVNISARHLQEPDFVQRLSELLARHEEPLAESLKLEVVESAAHADLEASSALLSRCRALGVRSALDDFGTGYSTLTHLQRLPVDVLKIDRSFVNHMLDDAQDRALVDGVIGLARTFGCSVVAEGVESPAQARMLLELGCDLGQGTGIGAPMPASQVTGWVKGYGGMFALGPAPLPPGRGAVGAA
jgi:diguanylate cyclase (GGDEF)-like protein/PAS domain S-box-containing protein